MNSLRGTDSLHNIRLISLPTELNKEYVVYENNLRRRSTLSPLNVTYAQAAATQVHIASAMSCQRCARQGVARWSANHCTLLEMAGERRYVAPCSTSVVRMGRLLQPPLRHQPDTAGVGAGKPGVVTSCLLMCVLVWRHDGKMTHATIIHSRLPYLLEQELWRFYFLSNTTHKCKIFFAWHTVYVQAHFFCRTTSRKECTNSKWQRVAQKTLYTARQMLQTSSIAWPLHQHEIVYMTYA